MNLAAALARAADRLPGRRRVRRAVEALFVAAIAPMRDVLEDAWVGHCGAAACSEGAGCRCACDGCRAMAGPSPSGS